MKQKADSGYPILCRPDQDLIHLHQRISFLFDDISGIQKEASERASFYIQHFPFPLFGLGARNIDFDFDTPQVRFLFCFVFFWLFAASLYTLCLIVCGKMDIRDALPI